MRPPAPRSPGRSRAAEFLADGAGSLADGAGSLAGRAGSLAVGSAPAVAAAATAAVTGWGVASAGPWRDELATRLAAGRSLADLWALTRTVDLVHLPYYLLAHGVLAVHDSVTALRLVSVAAMAATAAVLVVTARRLAPPAAAGRATGLAAGLLLAVAPLASRYGQEARPYALATLAAAVAAWRLVVATGHPSRGTWSWYAAAVVATGLANVLALTVLAGHAVFVLVCRRASARRWAGSTAVALAVLSPFLAATSRQSGQVGWLTRPDGDDLRSVLSAPFGGLVLPAALLALAAVRVAAVRGTDVRGDRPALVLGAAWGLVPPVLLWLVSQWHPLFDGRYVVAALPGLALAIGTLAPAGHPGGRAPRRRAAAAAAVTVLVGVLAIAGRPAQLGYRDRASGHGEDVRGAARIVTSGARPGDAVLFVPYHLRIVLLPGAGARPPAAGDPPPDDVALARGPAASATLTGVDVPPGELAGRLAGHRRVWLVSGPGGPPRTPSELSEASDRAKLDVLAREFTETERWRVAGFTVVLLARRPDLFAGAETGITS